MPAYPQQFARRPVGPLFSVGWAVFLVCLFSSPQPAVAQDCGSWPRPVLCEAALVAISDGGDDQRFDGRSACRLAPRGRMDLELSGFDQRDRPFPAERVALRYDEAGCRRLVDIQDRGQRRWQLSGKPREAV